MHAIDTRARFRGCLLGLAVGDAVGAAVEFQPRGTFPPLTGMAGGGPWSLAPGQWTDDTSMALCLAESLVTCRGFDPLDQMQRYVRWYKEGHWSAKGYCFDIGNTTRAALDRFRAQRGDAPNPFQGRTDPHTAGNGSIMRLAPVPMAFAGDRSAALEYAAASSRTTHAAPAALDGCRLLADLLLRALGGAEKEQVLLGTPASDIEHPAVRALARGDYRKKDEGEIKGSGYVVESLEAALWCFDQTHSYRDAVLRAANLGDDADTTAAVAGQIAGAFYGTSGNTSGSTSGSAEGIPPEWLAQLAQRDAITGLADALQALAAG